MINGYSRSTTSSAPPAAERYEVGELLGRGSRGRVYRARDRHAGRTVALKVLDADCGVERERFHREALIAGRLRCRSIVKVFELGELNGRPFLAMQYVDGGNLRQQRLELPVLVAVMRDVAAALSRAHEAGIVHRDLKPENVLLDRHQRAYLADFGLARDLSGKTGLTLSLEGQIAGTPWCMSPEQARGDHVDARTDLFSLGATLYYQITGQRPFEGDHVIDVLHAVLHDAPPPPSRWRPDVPEALERIVVRCLEKDPDARFASAAQLADELQQLREPRPPEPVRRGGWLGRLWPANAPATSPRAVQENKVMNLDQETLDRELYGVGSHVHVLDALEGLSAGDAGRRPDGAPHSIFQEVEHMRYWLDIALARIQEESHDTAEHADDGWTAPVAPADEAQWKGAFEGFRRSLQHMERHLDEALRVSATEGGRQSPVYRNVNMVRGHNSYHVAQIVLLRRMLGCWPPPRGGDTW